MGNQLFFSCFPGQVEDEVEPYVFQLGTVNMPDGISSETAKVATGDGIEIQQDKPARLDKGEGIEEEPYVFQFGTVNMPDGISSETAKVATGDGIEIQQDKPARLDRGEEIEEEAYVFQFGTVNVPDDDVLGNADLSGEGQETQGSPESRRVKGGVCEVSPGSSLSQPLQTQQLRGGVFSPANSSPPLLPSLERQQDQRWYMAPQAYNHHHPLQQSHEGHIPVHHQQHQHEVLTQQDGALQQGGFSHDNGMYGVSRFHQHRVYRQHHHQQSHLPYQRGVGVPGHPLHGSSGQHSPHGGQMVPPQGGQYGVGHHSFRMMQQQGSTPGGYWGGGMMHHHVPGQHVMAPAPRGIGVTDGHAVCYPARPHMIAPEPWMPDGGHEQYGRGQTSEEEVAVAGAAAGAEATPRSRRGKKRGGRGKRGRKVQPQG